MVLLPLLLVVLAAVGVGRSLRAHVRRGPAANQRRVLATLDSLTREPATADRPAAVSVRARDRLEGSRRHVRLVPAADVRRGRRVVGEPAGLAEPALATASGTTGLAEATGLPEATRLPEATGLPETAVDLRAAAAPATSTAAVRLAGPVVPSGTAPITGRPRKSAHRSPTTTAALAPAARAHRRRHRGGSVVAGAAALALVGLVAVWSGRTSPTPRLAPVALPAVTVPTPSAPPATTAQAGAPASPVALVSSSPEGSVFSMPGQATITVTASAASWAELRSTGPSGTVVYEGTLQPGQAQTLSGPSWMRLGNPTAVTVAVDGKAVTPPASASGQPTNLQFG